MQGVEVPNPVLGQRGDRRRRGPHRPSSPRSPEGRPPPRTSRYSLTSGDRQRETRRESQARLPLPSEPLRVASGTKPWAPLGDTGDVRRPLVAPLAPPPATPVSRSRREHRAADIRGRLSPRDEFGTPHVRRAVSGADATYVVVVGRVGEGDDAPALRRVRQSRAKRHVALQTTQVEEFTRAVVAAGDEEKTVGGGYQRADGSTVFLEVRDENAAGRPLIAGSARTVPAETRTADEGTVGLSDCRTVGRGRRRRGFAGDEIETLRHRRRQSVRHALRRRGGRGPARRAARRHRRAAVDRAAATPRAASGRTADAVLVGGRRLTRAKSPAG